MKIVSMICSFLCLSRCSEISDENYDLKQAVLMAAEMMAGEPEFGEDTLFERIMAAGFSVDNAARAITFVPLAIG